MSGPAPEPWPTELRIRRDERCLEIDFDSGERYIIPAELLRVESPSAEVKGHGSGEKRIVSGKRNVAILSAEAVGNYAVRLIFDDGHDTGLYSWSYLRRLGRDQAAIWQTYLDALAARRLSRDR
ncbi:MAG: DUF971 domain-containing protein [Alphaproteobacteria bacterium]|nr:DUF971 domain-containing protein [Alphaproteobacteria bacterium]